jgi:peptidoglycan LD-endopeptidase CwlK
LIEGLDPRLLPWARALLARAERPLVITSVRRSWTRQARLYRLFLAGGNPLPVAPPGSSMHEHGLAWDMWGPSEELRRLGGIWRSWGGIWGGDVDPVHFEAGKLLGT